MVFCLPSNLESFIPPPSEQRSQPPPWRGSIVVSGMGSSDQSSAQEIFVTAVETDGEKTPHWPGTFYVRINHERPVLRHVQAWIKECVPPLPICTFMPNRLREQNANTINQTNFRSLSRILFENQAVAVAPWGTNMFPGAGIIIYPAQNSSAILVGALFFIDMFPSFVDGFPSPNLPVSSNIMQSSSPIEKPIANHGQDPFRYSNLATYPNLGQSSSSAEATWSNKAEDDNGYATYPSTHENPSYP